MNVSLPRLLGVVLLFLLTPLLCSAQYLDEVFLETYRGNPVEYTYSSYPYNSNVMQQPEHGAVKLEEVSPNNWKVTYTPNAGYMGEDEFRVSVWTSGMPAIPSLRIVRVNVLPSKVIAKRDYATTFTDESIDLDVLTNDFSSSGELSLKNILLVNNGEASISNGGQSVAFTPNPGFQGIAHLNYVACDQYGSCDQATVSVNVLDEASQRPDTIEIFTKKNRSQIVLIPEDFDLAQSPENGVYTEQTDIPEYQPNQDFVGSDFLIFAKGNMAKVIKVTVLDVVDNTFAFDDEVNTSPYEPVEFNILDNDYYEQASGCLSFVQPEFGRVEKGGLPNGTMTYYPPEDFQGVDQFTYTIQDPECSGKTETATVYIYVSNHEPASSKFLMQTPKQTPLVIGYNVPITNFEFEVKEQAKLGTARFLEGDVDTVIYGQQIRGYNVILYVPDEGVSSGTDEFEILYCVNKNDVCQYRKSVKIEVDILDIGNDNEQKCIGDCVWAGDTNQDGIVDMEDLLPLGLYMGEVGKPRDSVDFSEWYGQFGENWGSKMGTSQHDIKHLDTDGDSIISARDTQAINMFYGRTHSLTDKEISFYQHPIELRGPDEAYPGDVIEFELVLGSDQQPAVDVYGFTFPFEYNPQFFDPNSVRVDFEGFSWLSYDSPVLSMSRNDIRGRVDAGYTRTNGKVASGFGTIGTIHIVVDEDINGIRPGDEAIEVTLGGGDARIMTGTGQSQGLRIGEHTLKIKLRRPEPESEERFAPRNEDLKVYPNPTRSLLNVHLNGGREFSELVLYNLTGQVVYREQGLQTQHRVVNLNNLDTGLYILSVITGEGVLNQRVKVVRD